MNWLRLAIALSIFSGSPAALADPLDKALSAAVCTFHKIKETVLSAGETASPACEDEQPTIAPPAMPSFPTCNLRRIEPPPKSDCEFNISSARYEQLNFLTRQAALAIFQNAGTMSQTLSCLFGKPVDVAQIAQAAADVAAAFCSNAKDREVYVSCTPKSGSAGTWFGSYGKFVGKLAYRQKQFGTGKPDVENLPTMVTVIHETLHAVIHQLSVRYKFTTDPDPKTSNRCLDSVTELIQLRCNTKHHDGFGKTITVKTVMSEYSMGDRCADHEPADDHFESKCRASAHFREEAAVRKISGMIARSCRTTLPLFFESTGDFRSN